MRPIKNLKKLEIHCHQELLKDLNPDGFIKDEIIMKWFRDYYSASKHLLILYSIARGLNAKKILEIGFGRSSFVLAKAVHENNGKLVCCDYRTGKKNINYSYLFSKKEKKVVDFVCGDTNLIWERDEGFDFAFMDYFGKPGKKIPYLRNEVENCVNKMKTNGVIAIHDVFVENCRIRDAIKEVFLSRKDLEYMVLPYNYGLGLFRYKGESKYGEIEDNFIKKKDTK